jgi:hypothetical protein
VAFLAIATSSLARPLDPHELAKALPRPPAGWVTYDELNLEDVRLPTGSNQTMAFQSFVNHRDGASIDVAIRDAGPDRQARAVLATELEAIPRRFDDARPYHSGDLSGYMADAGDVMAAELSVVYADRFVVQLWGGGVTSAGLSEWVRNMPLQRLPNRADADFVIDSSTSDLTEEFQRAVAELCNGNPHKGGRISIPYRAEPYVASDTLVSEDCPISVRGELSDGRRPIVQVGAFDARPVFRFSRRSRVRISDLEVRCNHQATEGISFLDSRQPIVEYVKITDFSKCGVYWENTIGPVATHCELIGRGSSLSESAVSTHSTGTSSMHAVYRTTLADAQELFKVEESLYALSFGNTYGPFRDASISGGNGAAYLTFADEFASGRDPCGLLGTGCLDQVIAYPTLPEGGCLRAPNAKWAERMVPGWDLDDVYRAIGEAVDSRGQGGGELQVVAPLSEEGGPADSCSFAPVAAPSDQQLEEAIAAVTAAGGGTVFLRAGNYLLTRPLVIPAGVRLAGGATQAVRLYWRPNDPTNLDRLVVNADAGAATVSEVTLCGLETDGTAITVRSGRGVLLDQVEMARFRGGGVSIATGAQAWMRSCYVEGSRGTEPLGGVVGVNVQPGSELTALSSWISGWETSVRVGAGATAYLAANTPERSKIDVYLAEGDARVFVGAEAFQRTFGGNNPTGEGREHIRLGTGKDATIMVLQPLCKVLCFGPSTKMTRLHTIHCPCCSPGECDSWCLKDTDGN